MYGTGTLCSENHKTTMKDYFLLIGRRNHEADLFKTCVSVSVLDSIGSVELDPDSKSDSGPRRLK
jgi:hypothetical protein